MLLFLNHLLHKGFSILPYGAQVPLMAHPAGTLSALRVSDYKICLVNSLASRIRENTFH